MIQRTLTILAVALIVAGLAGCKPNAASVRKEAQANADKYFEFVKAGNLEGAYNNTFGSSYKRQLPLEAYVKFQQKIDAWSGPIEAYQAEDQPQIDLDRNTVKFEYTVKAAKLATTLKYDVRMVQEGSEWRVDSLEPKFSEMAPTAPSAPLPKPSGTPPKP